VASRWSEQSRRRRSGFGAPNAEDHTLCGDALPFFREIIDPFSLQGGAHRCGVLDQFGSGVDAIVASCLERMILERGAATR
jgi:hypothetical protein